LKKSYEFFFSLLILPHKPPNIFWFLPSVVASAEKAMQKLARETCPDSFTDQHV
jgi:hypothetical protein